MTEKEFDPAVLVEHIDSFGKHLTEWEIKFIANLMDSHPLDNSCFDSKGVGR